MKKTFLETLATPEELKPNHSQLRVLRKVVDASTPKHAAEQVLQAEDSRNLVAATKILAKYGFVTTIPEDLGPNDEPKEIDITETGYAMAEDYNVQGDDTLLTQKEQEQAAPTGPGPDVGAEEEMPGEELGGEAEPGAELPDQTGAEQPIQPQGGVGLELSHFFHDINDLAKLKS